MIDKDKVVSALDCLANGNGHECLRFPCPYEFYGYLDCDRSQIMLDAIELLKEYEQEHLDFIEAVARLTTENSLLENKLKKQGTVRPVKAKGYEHPLYVQYAFECSECNTLILRDQPYCCGCGKKVNWND